jgi:hypothetical protein
MTNVLQFPSKKSAIHEILVTIETTLLEDGTQWYRIGNVKTGEWGDWIKSGGDGKC